MRLLNKSWLLVLFLVMAGCSSEQAVPSRAAPEESAPAPVEAEEAPSGAEEPAAEAADELGDLEETAPSRPEDNADGEIIIERDEPSAGRSGDAAPEAAPAAKAAPKEELKEGESDDSKETRSRKAKKKKQGTTNPEEKADPISFD